MIKKIMILAAIALSSVSMMAEEKALPAPDKSAGLPVMEAFSQRKSVRNFSDRELSRIKRTNVLRNVWTQMAQITLICGLLVLYATNNSGEHCGLYFVGFAAMVGIAVVFVVWLFWFLYVVWSKRHLAPMALKGYKILDSIDFILFCYWILCWFFPVLIQPWCISIIEAVWIASAVIAYKFRKELL